MVSTPLGAEGLANQDGTNQDGTNQDGDICALAETPQAFADHILHLFDHPDAAMELAHRARRYVETSRDIRHMTAALTECYRAEIRRKTALSSSRL